MITMAEPDGKKPKNTPKAAEENLHKNHRQRKRQQFLRCGLDSFSDHEALELLLYFAIPRRDVNPLAHILINRYGSLAGVFDAPVEDLANVAGIGESAAVLIKLVPQIYVRAAQLAKTKRVPLNTTEQIGAFFIEYFKGEILECLYETCLDAKGHMICCQKVAEGDAGSVTVSTKKIVENALISNAVMVALAHNHPSGVPEPSPQDKETTLQIQEALRAVKVELVEHIIVADGKYVSLRHMGLLD